MKYLLLILLGVTLILTGCSSLCPVSCEDKDFCTTDSCSISTLFRCKHEITMPCVGNGFCEEGEYGEMDCPSCDDSNVCTNDQYDYALQQCNNTNIIPCCGNAISENSESCSTCPQDVKCRDGELCCKDCIIPKCIYHADCNDNLTSTQDSCRNPRTCNAVCTNTPIIKCIDDDMYCPSNCDMTEDTDCLLNPITGTRYNLGDIVNIQNQKYTGVFLQDYFNQYCYEAGELSKTYGTTIYYYTVCITTPYSRAMQYNQSSIEVIEEILNYKDFIITIIGPKESVQLLKDIRLEVGTKIIYPVNTWTVIDKSKVSMKFTGYDELFNESVLINVNKYELAVTINMSNYR